MKNILFIRTVPHKLDWKTYNVQGLGMGKAFCSKGYNFDFLYFTSKKEKEEVVDYQVFGENKLRIINKRGYRFLRTGYCFDILDKEFLSKYDLIISNEYGQMMTYLLSKTVGNVALYSGPYYNLFKIPFFSKPYDLLTAKSINKNISVKFTKSLLAKNFLENKGYSNVLNIGVGLDINKFEVEPEITDEISDIYNFINKKNKTLLYVGALSRRKNFPFLLKLFRELKQEQEDINLLIIGKGNPKYVKKYMSILTDEINKDILIIDKVENSLLKLVYKKVDLFVLPSIKEIFGMVLLESMYFGLPVISSLNGGSSSLINDSENGYVVENYDLAVWKDKILEVLSNKSKNIEVGKAAHFKIVSEFTWDKICERIILETKLEN